MASRLRACAWAVAALLTAPALLCAKTAAAQVGAYAQFTGANLDVGQTSTRIYGPTFGIYANLPIPIVKIGADLRGYLLNGSGKQHYNGVIGPRIEVHIPVINIKLYGEFLVGVGSYNKEIKTHATLDYEFAVGVDRKLISILDWRILEFSDCNYFNGSLYTSSTAPVPTRALSTGLVVRIP
jgi:hypothetical protein